jgi:hypothetical protein
MHHKAREMLVAQRTQLINALRGHLAEMGVIAAQGLKNARELARLILAEGDETIPACVRMALVPLCGNCMFWTRRSRAATEPSPRWLETTKWRAA